ncbi:MAG: acyltransferase [Azonexus sp.]|nr:acyltransferase [Azonexus sp.]
MTQQIPFRPDIEGLRAVAILLVVAAHARLALFDGGYVGVDVFFVLSGYLITGILVEEIRKEGSLSLVQFYARRFRRLAPAMLFMFLGVCFLSATLLSPSRQLAESNAAIGVPLWVSNFFYLFSQFDYFDAAAEDSLFLHTWSLGVEEQFYLAWPLLLIAVLCVGVGRRSFAERERMLFFLMIAVLLASLSWNVLLTPEQPMTAFYMMPTRAWQFALGALVWLSMNKSATVPVMGGRPYVNGLVGWLGLGMLLLAALFFDAHNEYPGWRSLLPSVGAAAMIASGAIQKGKGTIAHFLSQPFLRYIGRISYSWYLWHWPVLLLGRKYAGGGDSLIASGVCVLVSLVLAILSWRMVELPLRRYRGWEKQPRLMIGLTLGVLLLASASSLWWGALSLDRMQDEGQARIIAAQMDLPVLRKECDDWYHSSRLVVCQSDDKNTAVSTAVLIGDSVGVQWFPAIQKIFEKQGWKLVVLTKSACPMVDVPFFYVRIGRRYTECEIWRNKALAYIAEIRPRIVIVGSSPIYPFSAEEWAAGTYRVWQSLSQAAGEVAVIRATPLLPFDGLDCLASGRLAQRLLNSCRTSPPFPDGDDLFAIQQRIAAGFDHVRLIDMTDDVCPGGVCAAETNGIIAWRDKQHLTAKFVATLSAAFSRRVLGDRGDEKF